jgi:hypothetical protein
LDRKIRSTELRVIACPGFVFRKKHCAQDFAALHLWRLSLLLCRLGVKRTGGLRQIGLCSRRSEGAMIRDRKPGTDRDCGD